MNELGRRRRISSYRSVCSRIWSIYCKQVKNSTRWADIIAEDHKFKGIDIGLIHTEPVNQYIVQLYHLAQLY
jgi:hypothetical protein